MHQYSVLRTDRPKLCTVLLKKNGPLYWSQSLDIQYAHNEPITLYCSVLLVNSAKDCLPGLRDESMLVNLKLLCLNTHAKISVFHFQHVTSRSPQSSGPIFQIVKIVDMLIRAMQGHKASGT